MQIIEYRIILPLTLEEYQVAQLFTIEESLKTETNQSKIVILRDELFDNKPLLGDNKYSSGRYTLKVYQWSNKIPNFFKTIFPLGATEIYEEAWDAYPYCRTILTSSIYTEERFYIKIESLHLAKDRCQEDNVHQLSNKLLQQRKVVHIDIANDEISPQDYKSEEDPRKFHSLKTRRGPLLGAKWYENCEPVMACYKLVTCEFKSLGLQNILETFFQRFERKIFTSFHRQLFCSMDRWCALALDIANGGNDRKDDDKKVKDTKLNLMEIEKTTEANE